MMPDGSVWQMWQRDEIRIACADMHERAIRWGLLILRGGNGMRLKWDSDDEELDKRVFTPADRDAAKALHSAVIRLPELRQRLVMQVFYREMCASNWGAVSWQRQRQIVDDLAQEVNNRIRAYDRECSTMTDRVRPEHFEGIRGRALRILCNNERMVRCSSIHPTETA